MIIYEKAENFRSIGEAQVMNFLATKDKTHEEIVKSENRILPVIPIYGGNATGKTNFLKITETLQNLVSKETELETLYKPCLFFDKEEILLEIVFIKNEIKYYFKVVYNKESILEEALYYYPNGRISKIYHKEKNKFTFGSNFEKDIQKYSLDVPKSMTFLRFLNKFLSGKVKFIDEAGEFFREDILILGLNNNLEKDLENAKEIFKKEGSEKILSNFVTDFYTHMNTGITGISFNVSNLKDKFLQELLKDNEINNILKNNKKNLNIDENIDSDLLKKLLRSQLEEKLELIYELNGKTIKIPIEEESMGIQKIFSIGIYFAEALTNGKVILFDELEVGFHIFLIKKIIKLFQKSQKTCQLIFTTHVTTLLDLKDFRRDQIFLTERTIDTNYQSRIKALSEISGIRKSTDIEKGYLNGNYCSVPKYVEEDSVND